MAAPVPSTGAVATSPSEKEAIWPLANWAAGATVVAPLAEGLAEPLAVALALAEGLALAEAVGVPP
jgi:hypothetical protein